MTNKEIEDYINTYRLYPPEYTGKKDMSIIRAMGSKYRHDIATNTITRLEGRINNNGDFEIVGAFTFPADKPEEKVPVPYKPYDIEIAIRTFNQLVSGIGYEDKVIAPGDNRTLEDMVSEVEAIRSSYYDKDHVNSKLRAEDVKEFNRRTARLRYFLRTYEKYTSDN